jgi:hypothetical protein
VKVCATSGLRFDALHIEIDENTPLARVRTALVDGVVTICAESGAFEDTKRPRQLSTDAIASTVGRALFKVADRTTATFADAPADADLTLPQVAAWDTYAAGRLSRVGVRLNQQRWRYNFRNRHGFSDVADAAFDRLWSADQLGWSDVNLEGNTP